MAKDKDEGRSELRNAERSLRTKQLMVRLGLWERLSETNLLGRLLNTHYPHISAELGARHAATRETEKVLSALQKAMRHATLEVPILGDDFPITDYFAYVKPIMDVLHAARSDNKSLNEFLTLKKAETESLAAIEFAAKATLSLHKVCDDVLVQYGRIDRTLYFVEPDYGRRPDGKWFLRFLLQIEPCRRRDITPPGEALRVAYQCGQPFGRRRIDWACLPSSLFKIKGPDRLLPVYVQGHALDRLYRREARASFIQDGDWIVHDYLWSSLRKVEKLLPFYKRGQHLIEYWLNVHRIGYLLVEPIGDVILVRTFLFLTMDGTPEGDQLRRKLQLNKYRKEDLGLDKIETYLQTDIQFDAELVQILSECGCGHLFKILIQPPPPDRVIPGYADQLREYIALVRND